MVCKPCLAFDSLGALIFSDYCRSDIPYIKEKVQAFFSEIHINPSNEFFNLLIKHYSLTEIESFDLKTLVDIYPKYIDESPYISKYKEDLLRGFQFLQAVNFDAFWEKECLPILNKQCDEFLFALDKKMINNLLADIQKIKQDNEITDIHVSMTYFMWPVSFHLTANSYLTNCKLNDTVNPNNIMQLLTHELCHRFSNSKTREIYQDTCKKDKYLKKTNWFLSVIMGSPGDEEEFVVALEHAIAVKNNLETIDEAYENIFNHYKSCMPVALILFNEFTKLHEIPEDINLWIYEKFIDGTIKAGEIENKIKTILPGYIENFEKFWLIETEKNMDKV